MKQILIIKTSAFGDIVHTYPVVAFLKEKFPDARIDWVVESACADLVRSHPHISNTFTVETKKWRRAPFTSETLGAIKAFRKLLRREEYDVVFDLQGNTKSGLILSQVRAKAKVGFGRESVPEWPNLLFTNQRFSLPKWGNIRNDYLRLVGAFLGYPNPSCKGNVALRIADNEHLQLIQMLSNPMLNGTSKIMVCPGSAWKNKQMDKTSLITLLKKISVRLNASFMFAWGSPDEKVMAEELQKSFPGQSFVLEKMPLPMLQNLMNRCDLVIAMDSLPLHLAGTTSAATLSVFGASSSDKYRPVGARHFSYQGSCPYGRTFEKRCPVLRTCSTGACIRDLTGGEIFDSFNQWWKALEEETAVHKELNTTK